jgi:hypothetical protein
MLSRNGGIIIGERIKTVVMRSLMSVSEVQYTNRFQINDIMGKISDYVNKK